MSEETLPRVVVVGGGTGMPVLLRGLKDLPIQLTALVTVADDGGSTGRLRNEMAIPAPGDIRNVIAALSDAEPMLIELFQHRFSVGNGLSGHSMGNLLLAAMTSITGNFNMGIREISRVLNVKGKIYPISNDNMSLHAEMEDGTIISGESNIPLSKKRIERVFLSPQPVQPLPNAVRALKKADLIVIAPGSLYTSIMPTIIMPQIDEAIRHTTGQVVYVCNVMTQAGETTGYTAADHVQAIRDHIGEKSVDAIVVHNEPIEQTVRDMYAEENAAPVIYDTDRLLEMGLRIIEGDIIDPTQSTLRHDNHKVASLLYSILKNNG
ncbi:MAG: gluconeogenesis factor YvcK family protein [Bacillota bacterium]|uniref:Gluconeogenesis factor n=1 Tax=Virgibacillus salarius TaxID=447199 RepID=A0A941I9U7_9BACI|nr:MULTISPECIES: YvcK family protein [Bacillaceae]NAZ08645.1 uridine diphosphate-N-acetylglucosamine-binding protein YvcK [Agaribacter marinus]MBR7795933.1 YvcK family protein [Virgibacillus salarius]MCC2248710.1 YvcK family protein [Virgibacillus sp. AGTR]MDY7043994.1 YvcK family protein [Virgibacillus sp. M23]QRZ17995.1 YvcK family protein [Virgibacillus sp. AGTR]